ncbi:MAG: EFR1 family ferrodoxin [Spirochaetaceae bacterium]
MKSTILYFSGTGNTHFIASIINDIRSKHEDISMIPFEKYDKSQIKDSSRIYLGFPVYALNVVSILKQIISQDLEGKEVYIFTTMAYSAGAALYNTAKTIKKNNGNIIGGRSIIMPGSDGLSFVSPDSKIVKKMLNRDFSNIPEVELIFEDLIKIDNGDYTLPKDSQININKFSAALFNFIAFLMRPFERSLSKKLAAGKDCTGCGHCEKICPVNNITVSGKFVKFDKNCFLCMRCINHCPTKTINIGKLSKGKYRYPGPGDSNFKPLKLM